MEPYKSKHHIRIVTAASLFDGHDVSINIMRRILQSTGAEVIHLGHNRKAEEVINCAIQEDAHAIALTSYQGGHMEYFKYMYDLLQEKGAGHIKVFGGGGGTILPAEIRELQDYGIAALYSPDDGRKMGLQGMINELMVQCDYDIIRFKPLNIKKLSTCNQQALARMITLAENDEQAFLDQWAGLNKNDGHSPPVLGITGTGGAGKSSIVDELIWRLLNDFREMTVAILSVDPSRKRTGGALLGDRIRMNAIDTPRVYMRSLATRASNISISKHIGKAIDVVRAAGFNLIMLETSGIGQSDIAILDFADLSVYVMTPEYGAATQLEKIDMLDFADMVVINKFDKPGAGDAMKEVKKQYQRNHHLWSEDMLAMPVFGTIASHFNDPGMNQFFISLIKEINQKKGTDWNVPESAHSEFQRKFEIIPPKRTRYLAEISEVIRNYNKNTKEEAEKAEELYAVQKTLNLLEDKQQERGVREKIHQLFNKLRESIQKETAEIIDQWPEKYQQYQQDEFHYQVRDQDLSIPTFSETLAHSKIPKVILPRYKNWGEIVRWSRQENVPGEFPYTAGVFPFKRETEDATRMFAGEGAPERTNKRFHYLSKNQEFVRLSTAFDSVTLYGEDPDPRPDIYGKVGNSGVSICCLDDAKKLYSGFNLVDPFTSVSMTINGPAATMAAFFMNTAIDQQCELHIRENGMTDVVEKKLREKYEDQNLSRPLYHDQKPDENDGLGLLLLGLSGEEVLPAETYERIKSMTLSSVRGTVQADILKEDQAQNTCIFSTEFSLRLMGDVQQYFVENRVRNFYSVSISGYHIAEAGANPITQLAFTLANGFTYVEYYMSRGMDIDEFAPNLSFFFSNGIDAEYAVIGRVARRIWSKAIKYYYNGNERAQKLKYHIQTSGRSLHAQEISFNDIRTTLQALYAIYDNCNSLHTNAYDEALTTPTEESVRRAMAIQMIINKELGLAKNQNPLQGSFLIESLTDLVEEAVMAEFDRISERGGVLGAMERMYQRNRIQEESLHYESLKHSGKLPVVGVNTFQSSEGSPTLIPHEVVRATQKEKESQIETVNRLKEANKTRAAAGLKKLQRAALKNENTFAVLMEVSKYCSLGQITHALFEVGGQYRRNM